MEEREPRTTLEQPGREQEALAALAIVDSVLRTLVRWSERPLLGVFLRPLLRRPAVEPNHSEHARSRAQREFHQLATSTVRFGLWAGLCAISAGAIGLALSWGHRETASVGITTAAALLGFVAAFGAPYLWLWVTAPLVQRNELRSQLLHDRRQSAAERKRAHDVFVEMDTAHRDAFQKKWDETEDLRRQFGEAKIRIAELETTGAMDALARLAAAKLQFGTELRDIRHKIEIVRSTRPHPHYSDGFRLPAFRWDEYDELVAVQDPGLYTQLERAYVAAYHVNSTTEMRRTRAGEGVTLGVLPEDGLDAAYDLAGDALDALGEERGDVWESGYGKALRIVTEDIAAELQAERSRIVGLLNRAINEGQQLFQRRVASDVAWERWLAAHAEWRDLVNGDDGELKKVLPLVDYHRVNEMSGLPDSVEPGEFDFNANHARARLYIDRRLKNLVAVLSDYREP